MHRTRTTDMVPERPQRNEAKQLKDVRHRDPRTDRGEINPRHGGIPRTQRREERFSGGRRASLAEPVEQRRGTRTGCSVAMGVTASRGRRGRSSHAFSTPAHKNRGGIRKLSHLPKACGCPRATQLSLPTPAEGRDKVKYTRRLIIASTFSNKKIGKGQSEASRRDPCSAPWSGPRRDFGPVRKRC